MCVAIGNATFPLSIVEPLSRECFNEFKIGSLDIVSCCRWDVLLMDRHVALIRPMSVKLDVFWSFDHFVGSVMLPTSFVINDSRNSWQAGRACAPKLYTPYIFLLSQHLASSFIDLEYIFELIMNHSISYTFNVSVEGTQGSRGSRGRRWIHRKSKMNNQQSTINNQCCWCHSLSFGRLSE